MFDLLHNFEPSATLISFSGVQIYWYGMFIVAGILASLSVSLKLAKRSQIPPEKVFDLAFWLIIFGILGARVYHVFLEFGYYLEKPLDIIKIWQGGLAIHGGIIAGLITVYFFCKKQSLNFWKISAILTPGIALAQAIGRWGNYFNQELFGLPTSLPWGIPIDIMKRPHAFISSEYFHPTFLYESLGNLLIFTILLILVFNFIKKDRKNYQYIVIAYLIMYSILRFSLEFIRIDRTPTVMGLRWPQIASIVIILASLVYLIWKKQKKGGIMPKADPLPEKAKESQAENES
ncbi:prolipoprotein diacylglyceryl transferase [Candidatus Falkowbacteria bacterium]|nr:prolipoprotein diacylglyceryl transferase [Candidatus Falkowbacteria bacterium]